MTPYNLYCILDDLKRNELLKGQDVEDASLLIDLYEDNERWTKEQYKQAERLVDKYEA